MLDWPLIKSKFRYGLIQSTCIMCLKWKCHKIHYIVQNSELNPKILSRTYWKLYGRISSGSSAGAGVNPGLIWHLYQADGQFLPLSIDSECIEYFEEIRESTGEHWRLLGYKTICGRCVESKIYNQWTLCFKSKSFSSNLFKSRALKSPILEHCSSRTVWL